MKKVLIADGSEEFRTALFELLGMAFEVRSCAGGNEALELMKSFRPDVAVVDLMLPEIDGLTLIQMAADCGIRPAVLATTLLLTEYARYAAPECGVQEIMIKPCNLHAVQARVADMARRCRAVPVVNTGAEAVTAGYLLEMGFCPKHAGFRQLRVGIPLFAQDPCQLVTKELYPAVAELCECENWHQVERDMRKAILAAWERRNEDAWNRFFPTELGGCIRRPSNSVFISRMAEQLLDDVRQR